MREHWNRSIRARWLSLHYNIMRKHVRNIRSQTNKMKYHTSWIISLVNVEKQTGIILQQFSSRYSATMNRFEQLIVCHLTLRNCAYPQIHLKNKHKFSGCCVVCVCVWVCVWVSICCARVFLELLYLHHILNPNIYLLPW